MATTDNSNKTQLIADIYNMYARELMAYFMSYTHNEMAAEDMLHDLFVKVIGLDVVNKETAKSLLFVTARRMMIDDARHKAFVRQYEKDALAEMNRYDQYSVERRLDAELRDEFNIAVVEGDIASSVDAERISRLESARLARMPQKSAQVYELCFHEERSAREIAELMQMNQRTVEGHIYRCRKEMREYLRKVM